MLLLWAGHLAVKNIQLTHAVPYKHVLKLTAKKITGKKKLAIEDVKGQYADWLFASKHIILNTLDHVVHLEKMSMNCKKPNIEIRAESGILNLKSSNAMIQRAHLTHHNMVFTCPKATYNHLSQKIICFYGKVTIRNRNGLHLNMEL